MKNKTKRHFTLLEVIIAMALTVVILMTLSYLYRDVSIIGQELDKSKTENFYLRYIENRLMSILPGPYPRATLISCFFQLTMIL